MTPDENESPPPEPKEPPAFGARPEKEDGLAIGLGVAQPTETDRPDSDRPEPRADGAQT